MKQSFHFILITILLVCGTGVFDACGSSQNDEEVSQQLDYEKIAELLEEFYKKGLSQEKTDELVDELKKGNDKLSTNLKQMIAAEKGGFVEEFVRQRGSHIEYEDGKVTVEIECEPGQSEAVVEKVKDYGVVELVISIGVQAVVPISNLEVIACIPGVNLVRLPIYAESEE